MFNPGSVLPDPIEKFFERIEIWVHLQKRKNEKKER